MGNRVSDALLAPSAAAGATASSPAGGAPGLLPAYASTAHSLGAPSGGGGTTLPSPGTAAAAALALSPDFQAAVRVVQGLQLSFIRHTLLRCIALYDESEGVWLRGVSRGMKRRSMAAAASAGSGAGASGAPGSAASGMTGRVRGGNWHVTPGNVYDKKLTRAEFLHVFTFPVSRTQLQAFGLPCGDANEARAGSTVFAEDGTPYDAGLRNDGELFTRLTLPIAIFDELAKRHVSTGGSSNTGGGGGGAGGVRSGRAGRTRSHTLRSRSSKVATPAVAATAGVASLAHALGQHGEAMAAAEVVAAAAMTGAAVPSSTLGDSAARISALTHAQRAPHAFAAAPAAGQPEAQFESRVHARAVHASTGTDDTGAVGYVAQPGHTRSRSSVTFRTAAAAVKLCVPKTRHDAAPPASPSAHNRSRSLGASSRGAGRTSGSSGHGSRRGSRPAAVPYVTAEQRARYMEVATALREMNESMDAAAAVASAPTPARPRRASLTLAHLRIDNDISSLPTTSGTTSSSGGGGGGGGSSSPTRKAFALISPKSSSAPGMRRRSISQPPALLAPGMSPSASLGAGRWSAFADRDAAARKKGEIRNALRLAPRMPRLHSFIQARGRAGVDPAALLQVADVPLNAEFEARALSNMDSALRREEDRLLRGHGSAGIPETVYVPLPASADIPASMLSNVRNAADMMAGGRVEAPRSSPSDSASTMAGGGGGGGSGGVVSSFMSPHAGAGSGVAAGGRTVSSVRTSVAGVGSGSSGAPFASPTAGGEVAAARGRAPAAVARSGQQWEDVQRVSSMCVPVMYLFQFLILCATASGSNLTELADLVFLLCSATVRVHPSGSTQGGAPPAGVVLGTRSPRRVAAAPAGDVWDGSTDAWLQLGDVHKFVVTLLRIVSDFGLAKGRLHMDVVDAAVHALWTLLLGIQRGGVRNALPPCWAAVWRSTICRPLGGGGGGGGGGGARDHVVASQARGLAAFGMLASAGSSVSGANWWSSARSGVDADGGSSAQGWRTVSTPDLASEQYRDAFGRRGDTSISRAASPLMLQPGSAAQGSREVTAAGVGLGGSSGGMGGTFLTSVSLRGEEEGEAATSAAASHIALHALPHTHSDARPQGAAAHVCLRYVCESAHHAWLAVHFIECVAACMSLSVNLPEQMWTVDDMLRDSSASAGGASATSYAAAVGAASDDDAIVGIDTGRTGYSCTSLVDEVSDVAAEVERVSPPGASSASSLHAARGGAAFPLASPNARRPSVMSSAMNEPPPPPPASGPTLVPNSGALASLLSSQLALYCCAAYLCLPLDGFMGVLTAHAAVAHMRTAVERARADATAAMHDHKLQGKMTHPSALIVPGLAPDAVLLTNLLAECSAFMLPDTLAAAVGVELHGFWGKLAHCSVHPLTMHKDAAVTAVTISRFNQPHMSNALTRARAVLHAACHASGNVLSFPSLWNAVRAADASVPHAPPPMAAYSLLAHRRQAAALAAASSTAAPAASTKHPFDDLHLVSRERQTELLMARAAAGDATAAALLSGAGGGAAPKPTITGSILSAESHFKEVARQLQQAALLMERASVVAQVEAGHDVPERTLHTLEQRVDRQMRRMLQGNSVGGLPSISVADAIAVSLGSPERGSQAVPAAASGSGGKLLAQPHRTGASSFSEAEESSTDDNAATLLAGLPRSASAPLLPHERRSIRQQAHVDGGSSASAEGDVLVSGASAPSASLALSAVPSTLPSFVAYPSPSRTRQVLEPLMSPSSGKPPAAVAGALRRSQITASTGALPAFRTRTLTPLHSPDAAAGSGARGSKRTPSLRTASEDAAHASLGAGAPSGGGGTATKLGAPASMLSPARAAGTTSAVAAARAPGAQLRLSQRPDILKHLAVLSAELPRSLLSPGGTLSGDGSGSAAAASVSGSSSGGGGGGGGGGREGGATA